MIPKSGTAKKAPKRHKHHPGSSAGKHSAANVHIGLEQMAHQNNGAIPRAHAGGILRKPIPSTKLSHKKKS